MQKCVTFETIGQRSFEVWFVTMITSFFHPYRPVTLTFFNAHMHLANVDKKGKI